MERFGSDDSGRSDAEAANRRASTVRRIAREDGAMLVETGIAAASLLMVLFGIIEICHLLYSYNYVSNAARDATRYAMLRGPNSCTDATNTPFPDCGLSPTKFTSTTDPTKNPLLNYVELMGYPGLSASNTSMDVNFLVATKTSGGLTTWATDSSCSSTSDSDSNGNACNNVGNMIHVKVTYQFPLNVPFWKRMTVPVTSTSQLMISE
ncbi:MAG TPA: TadE/TadG family type IV pilus assembly protein [Terracidiphilus sp.]